MSGSLSVTRGRGADCNSFATDNSESHRLAGLDPESLKTTSIYMDRDGAIWCGTVQDGVVRIYQGHAEYYTHEHGLSGNCVESITEDHEGNIWIATSLGIDQLRDLSFKPVYRRESGSDIVEAALPLHDGSVLFKSEGKLFILRNGHSRRVQHPPGEIVTAMFEDREAGFG